VCIDITIKCDYDLLYFDKKHVIISITLIMFIIYVYLD